MGNRIEIPELFVVWCPLKYLWIHERQLENLSRKCWWYSFLFRQHFSHYINQKLDDVCFGLWTMFLPVLGPRVVCCVSPSASSFITFFVFRSRRREKMRVFYEKKSNHINQVRLWNLDGVLSFPFVSWAITVYR